MDSGRVVGVRFRDALGGATGEAQAPVVFNATGAWSPGFAQRNGVRVPMRPGKGVHLTLDRRFSNCGITCTAVDGRQMFLMPHENRRGASRPAGPSTRTPRSVPRWSGWRRRSPSRRRASPRSSRRRRRGRTTSPLRTGR